MPPRRRNRTRRYGPWIIVTVVVVVALVASFGIAWAGAGALLTPDHRIATSAGTVQSVTSDTITLQKRASTLRVGTYGLEWTGGSAILGPIEHQTTSTVTRGFEPVNGQLRRGTHVILNPDVWSGNPESSLGIPFKNVDVPDPLGDMPAWKVDGHGSTWVIFVHGIDGERQGGLRPLPTLAAAGLPTLLITYRNDVGAPPSPNGLFHLGLTEWHDLQAAAEYAVAHGASKFILYGDSMGGSIVTQFIRHSSLASRVIGMVLDSPVLDWSGVLQGQADRYGMPEAGPLLKLIVSLRGGIDLPALDELDHTKAFRGIPTLLFQGLSDKLVPPPESAAFAHAVGAEYVPVRFAGHIQSWNVNPKSYDEHLAAFLKRLGF